MIDTTVIRADGATRLRLPENAMVEVVDSSHITVVMEKTLAFAGHPPRPVRISKTRKYMGVAARKEGDTLEIATFGEWDSQIEGGAWMEVRFRVPHNLHYEKAAGLSGPRSRAQGWKREDASPFEASGDYWYAPTKPAEEWTSYVGG